MVDHIIAIRKYEDNQFIPFEVAELFRSILTIHANVYKLAEERNVDSKPFEGVEPPNECFPSLPLHTMKRKYEAKKKNEDMDCNKEYPKAPSITPGVAHVFCKHGICKGFTTMTTAENPDIFLNFLTRRLPQKVMAPRRIMLYDASCLLHKSGLNREPAKILNFKIFTDRHHWANHVGCSEAYNCDRYEYLKNVNSQRCEQKNRSLRKLSSTLAYSNFEHYMTKVKLFFIMNNLEEKSHF